MFENIPEICHKMNENEIDLKLGKVPTEADTLYLRDYKTHHAEIGFEEIVETVQFLFMVKIFPHL